MLTSMPTPDQQIFIVANIAGEYEILASLQYRWWDKEPRVLSRCLNLVRIFQADTNEADIKRELRRTEKKSEIERQSEGQRPRSRDGQRDQTNYPFIFTCLWIGVSLDFSNNPNPLSEQPQRMWRGKGECELCKYGPGDPCVRPPVIKYHTWIEAEGTHDRTIIDITEPAQVRFGIFSFEPGDNDAEGVWTGPIGFAMKYGPRYFHDDLQVYKELKSWPKIRVDALQNLKVETGIEYEECAAFDASGDQYRVELRQNIATDHMFSEGLAAALNERFLTDGVQMVAFQRLVIEKIQADPDLPLPVQTSLLATILKHAKEIDLTRFTKLKAPMLWEAFTQLRHHNPSGAKSLILPDLDDMTGDIFSAIVQAGCIYELNLGTTPRVGLGELLERIVGTRLRVFTCPALYQRSFLRAWREYAESKKDSDGEQLYKWRLQPRHATPASSFPNGTGTLFPLTRVVYMCVDKNVAYPRTPHGNGLLWSKLLRTNNEPSDVQFPPDYRGVGVWMQPFKASLQSCASLASTLPQLFAQLVRLTDDDLLNCNSDRAGVAAAIAAMRAAVGEELRIQPILAEQDIISWSKALKFVIPPVIDVSTPTDWMLYVFHERADHSQERSLSQLRHAFVGTSSKGERHVMDAEQFFKYICSKNNRFPAEAQLEASAIISKWTTGITEVYNMGELGQSDSEGELLRGRFSFGSSGRTETHEALKVVETYNSSVMRLIESLERNIDHA